MDNTQSSIKIPPFSRTNGVTKSIFKVETNKMTQILQTGDLEQFKLRSRRSDRKKSMLNT